MQKVVALCKRRGFIYPGSEIYGGLAGTWDYGPLGVLLKRNIKNEWWKDMVQNREDIVGLDGAIIMNPKVWEASGHVEAFSDPLVECKICHKRFRKDHFEEFLKSVPKAVGNVAPKEEYLELFLCSNSKPHELKQLTEPKLFNLLVEAFLGVTEPKQKVYLRGEITQGVHVNFKNVLDSTRVKIPFGIAQIGKAFRNEITPGNFTFRSREFEQMENQFYIEPKDTGGKKWFEYWKKARMDWYVGLGIKKENLRFRDHRDDERTHYARAATDIEYNSPFGWSEFEGIHHRGDWDLSRHQEYSGQNMKYRDPQSGDEYIPWVIETSGGVDRATLFFLLDAYSEENGKVILKLHPKLSPFKAAVFPLLSNKPDLVKLAKKIYLDLKKDFMVTWDERGNIGGRYASQDEIGTPLCVTVDFQSLEDKTVTVRDRDTSKQERIKLVDLSSYINSKLDK